MTFEFLICWLQLGACSNGVLDCLRGSASWVLVRLFVNYHPALVLPGAHWTPKEKALPSGVAIELGAAELATFELQLFVAGSL